MRPVTLVTAGLLLGFSLACSDILPPKDGTPTTDGTSTDGTSTDGTDAPLTLPEPWKSMMLPVADGEIVEASADSALISYPSASLITLTNTWTGALINDGYTQAEDVSKPGMTALVFRKGPNNIGLATGQEQGMNFAYVEDLGKVKRSMVRGQRGIAGTRMHRRMGGMRRPNGGN